METHKESVATIARRIQSFYEKKVPFRVYHGSTNSTRSQHFESDKIVDTSALSHIIEVDLSKKIALVEPNVPMDRLVAATMKNNLVPAVIPEFPGITVGGSYAGTAGESSSFKHGFFDQCVNWCEVVLGNGDVVTASPTENADLFDAGIGSFGTLGVATLFEIQLIDSSSTVEVTYIPVSSADEAVTLLRQLVRDDAHDFLDGILFSATYGVIIAAKRLPTSHTPPITPLQRFTRAHDPWFYLHAASAPHHHRTERVPLPDYLFRYDRGGFWTARHAFRIFPCIPFNRGTRALLDPLLRTRNMYRALHHSGYARRFVVQDLALPAGEAAEFVGWVEEALGIWPLWLCPIRGGGRALMHRLPGAAGPGKAEGQEEEEEEERLIVNVGVWGPGRGYGNGRAEFERFVEDNRRIERKVRELGGLKWLYAQSFYTEEEFWDIYDRAEYARLREKYHATTLPDVFEKTKLSEKEKAAGAEGSSPLRGVVKLLLFMNPLRPK